MLAICGRQERHWTSGQNQEPEGQPPPLHPLSWVWNQGVKGHQSRLLWSSESVHNRTPKSWVLTTTMWTGPEHVDPTHTHTHKISGYKVNLNVVQVRQASPPKVSGKSQVPQQLALAQLQSPEFHITGATVFVFFFSCYSYRCCKWSGSLCWSNILLQLTMYRRQCYFECSYAASQVQEREREEEEKEEEEEQIRYCGSTVPAITFCG